MTSTELARLEAHVLALLDAGGEILPAELRRAFPSLDPTEIERVSNSASILMTWQGELRERPAQSSGAAPAADSDWLRPGERLGGYVVERRVPGGGMGQVYQAAQESLYPRKVALKVYRLGAAPERELRRARKEAEVASRLLHPHLVAIHDLGHDPERELAYISMQFVDGPDLRAELCGADAGRDPAEERARVRRLVTRVSEVAGALAELHGRHHVHRDVKPENILVRRNAGRDGKTEAAVLVDFGLVRAERALGTGADALLAAGTPGYAPPESDLPGHAVTPAWDVYSLGVVLYELLRARPLARGEDGTPLRPTSAELAALRPAVPAVDADLLAVLTRAMHRDPAARYPDAGALQADLEGWLAALPVRARRAPVHERLWRSARRHPSRAALLFLAAALLVLSTRAAAWITAQARTVRAGELALASGRPAEGRQLLASARPFFVRLFLDERDGAVRDLLRETADHPLTQVARAERERGVTAGLHLAAAYLERDGYRLDGRSAYPKLESYLLRGIASGSPPEDRSRALHVLARLFYERPVLDRDDLIGLDPFRERLEEILHEGASTRDERLHALCALGGLGGLRELDLLLDRLDPADLDVEVLRLGITSIERIVRRLRPTEGRARLLNEAWGPREARLAEIWDGLTRRDDGGLDWGQHWQPVLLAWILLHRETEHELGSSWDLSGGAEGDLGRVRMALEGARNPELWARLVEIAETRVGLLPDPVNRWWWVSRLGELCAYVGKDHVREAVVLQLRAEPELAALLDEFDAGWESGRIQVEQGSDSLFEPDPRSRLRHLVGSGAISGPLVAAVALAGEEAGPRARWRFGATPTRAGRAADPILGGGTYRLPPEDNPAHLRLPRAGSWIDLPFDLATGDRADAWIVELRHQAASRYYLPFHGQAWIRIELDGAPLVERLLVQFMGLADLAILLEGPLLSPGTHTLRITLLEATTTYWLHEVRIRARS